MPAPPLRIAFFGTPELALPTLDALIDSRHDVVCVVSQPDRGRGRGRKLTPSPVAARALERDVPLLRPERVGEPDVVAEIEAFAPDVGVVVAFGQFIPKRVRELPKLGYLINAHASILPRHRGASPIAAAILAGDERTGISIMRVEKEMDAGAVALVREIPIGERENTEELGERLAQLAAEATLAALEQIADGSVSWTEQDASQATIAPKLEKKDGRLDWCEPTRALVRRIHALAPKPGAYTELPHARGEAPDLLRVLRAEAAGEDAPAVAPGTIRLGTGDAPPLAVATGDGWLAPLTVQRSGGRAMDVAAFLRGHALQGGARLGEPADEAGHA